MAAVDLAEKILHDVDVGLHELPVLPVLVSLFLPALELLLELPDPDIAEEVGETQILGVFLLEAGGDVRQLDLAVVDGFAVEGVDLDPVLVAEFREETRSVGQAAAEDFCSGCASRGRAPRMNWK
jgi:hypothetical protein